MGKNPLNTYIMGNNQTWKDVVNMDVLSDYNGDKERRRVVKMLIEMAEREAVIESFITDLISELHPMDIETIRRIIVRKIISNSKNTFLRFIEKTCDECTGNIYTNIKIEIKPLNQDEDDAMFKIFREESQALEGSNLRQ